MEKLRSTLQNKIIEDSLEDKVIFLDRQINPYKYISQAVLFFVFFLVMKVIQMF